MHSSLAGCGGPQAQVGPPPTVQQNPAKRAHNVATTAFTVSGRKILLNGQPFFAKGVDCENNQIDAYADSNPLDNANEEICSPDLDAMRAAGVNSAKAYNVTLNQRRDNSGIRASNAQKINTTTMVDDGLNTVRAGDANGFKIDAWGLDVYRGRTMGNIWQEIKTSTEKPEIMAEYGASAAYYPPSSARYDEATGGCNEYPPGPDKPPYYGLPPPRPWELANVKGNANELFAHWVDEWNDDGGNRAGLLNTLAGSPPDTRVKRPPLDAIKAV